MSADRAAWATGMQAVHREAAGLLTLSVVLVTDAPGLAVEAAGGSREAYVLLRSINHALTKIQDAPRHQPALCGGCSRPLQRGRYSFALAMPANKPDAVHRLAMAICRRCGTDHDTVRAAAERALQDVWPGGRTVAITHHAGGRA